MRSGSFHSKLPLFLPSMLRHSKRCLTQRKPPSLANCRSRAVVEGLPHRKTWTAGSTLGTFAPASGEGEGAGDAAGLGAAATAVAGAGAVGGGGAGGALWHATPARISRQKAR